MPDTWDYTTKRSEPSPAREQRPLITTMLCILSLVMTTAYLATLDRSGGPWYNLGHFACPPVEDIWSGRYEALITAAFVHGSVLHILFNLLWLWRLGGVLELTLNPLVYGLFFMTAAAVGSGAEIALDGQTGVGVSGVVYAMIGMMWAGRGRHSVWNAVATRDTLKVFLYWGLFCIAASYLPALGLNVANAAHAAGFVFGLSVGWVFFAPRRRWLWGIPLAALIALTVLSVTWMPWSGQWDFWKAGKEFDRKHFHNAIALYHRSIRLGFDESVNWTNISRSWNNIAVDEIKRNNSGGAIKAMEQSEAAEQMANKIHH